MDDLIRAGAMGLLKAIDKYDPQYMNKFTAFAIPVILGEIKAYFRDQGWGTKIPGKLQLHKLLVVRTVETLTQKLGRSPTVAEIGEASGLSQEEVFQTFEVGRLQQTSSTDARSAADKGEQYAHILYHPGKEDPDLESFAHDMDLNVALAGIDAREQAVLYLKLYSGLSQGTIARRLGISRMHVSRLHNRGVAKLRLGLQECVPR